METERIFVWRKGRLVCTGERWARNPKKIRKNNKANRKRMKRTRMINAGIWKH